MVNFNSLSEKEIQETSRWFYEKLKNQLNTEKFKIFQPMPSPIDKIQNRYRWRIIIKGNMTENIYLILNKILKEFYERKEKSIRVTIDVNPNNMI